MDSSPTANIIFDVPSKTDAFDGKGHERSAKALAEGIDQVFLNGGGAIGLEGAWGAGKSSVIEMAESRLEEIGQKDRSEPIRYHVFAFDLWTHQTDEFRRAFLERFLDFMSAATFDHQVDIEIQRDRIRNRKKEVTLPPTSIQREVDWDGWFGRSGRCERRGLARSWSLSGAADPVAG